MEIFQLVGIAFITAVTALLLKSTKPELAFAVSIAGGIILLLVAFELLENTLSVFENLASVAGLAPSLVKALLKMIGIGYLVEFSAGILTDFGQSALADKLVFCGKIAVLVLAVPVLENVLSLVTKLLGLIS